MMDKAILYALVAALTALLGLGGYAWVLSGTIDRLHAEKASLRASVAALEADRDLAREARAVADARRRVSEAKAREYDKLREGLLRDDEDADLPDWFRVYLERLLGQYDDAAGQPVHPE